MVSRASTGLDSLDEIIDGLRIGDNVVWQVDSIIDYKQFVAPYVNKGIMNKKKIIYIRFANHEPILESHQNIKIIKLNAHSGFETFSTQVYNIVRHEGEDAYYVFDCLSYLLNVWATDLMIGNFFRIICPYLFELNTIAYFAILRNNHSFKTIASIRKTTQILIDIYNDRGSFYMHPIKVLHRQSPTMFLPHLKKGDAFEPIANSIDATRLFSSMAKKEVESSKRNLDYWDRLFLKAEEVLKSNATVEDKDEMVSQLCKVMIGREENILSLARTYFSLEDLLKIKERLVGTGYLGGKTVGMLLARAILSKEKSYDWNTHLEQHDSFYIGSDVFYTYMVQNGWWNLRMEQKTTAGYFKVAKKLREKMLTGIFSEEIKEQFLQMLEYFGQYPIIVRSSSLLEDGFGNAFAGKYESVFCVNQGTPEERYFEFESAVRRIYASMLTEDALSYRLQRGLDQKDEQMALLVQRVSGAYHKQYFFPYLAGVGNSYNTFVWNMSMNPEAGMMRLVFGLGTRAVDRAEEDYPRIVALDAPRVRPLAGIDDLRRFSQHNVDVLNVEKNQFETVPLRKLCNKGLEFNLDLIGIRDYETSQRLKELGMDNQEAWILTFDKLLQETSFVDMMRRLLQELEKTYNYPIDMEFTLNFTKEKAPCINILQCRPLQTKGNQEKVVFPSEVNTDKVIMEFSGSFMGGNISKQIDRIIYVDPKKYAGLSLTEKYDIARLVGRLNKEIKDKEKTSTMLLGPGRWGTTTPSMGVPVSFSEINNISVIGEIAYREGNLEPELSYGSHFFQDLVETNIFYIAIFPGRKDVFYNKEWIIGLPNEIDRFASIKKEYKDVIKIYDIKGKQLKILADVISQKFACVLLK